MFRSRELRNPIPSLSVVLARSGTIHISSDADGCFGGSRMDRIVISPHRSRDIQEKGTPLVSDPNVLLLPSLPSVERLLSKSDTTGLIAEFGRPRSHPCDPRPCLRG